MGGNGLTHEDPVETSLLTFQDVTPVRPRRPELAWPSDVESQADASEHILKELHRIMQEVRTEVTAVKAEVQQVLAEVTVEVQQVRAEVTTELQQVRAEVTACYDTGLFRPRPTLATPEVQIRTSSRRIEMQCGLPGWPTYRRYALTSVSSTQQVKRLWE